MKIRFKVPAKFWDDHSERTPSDTGESGMCQEIGRSGSRVTIEGTAEQIECLRSDAAFYCDPWGPDECPPGLIRSAKATLVAVAKATSGAD